jgi:hypothetical protein
LAVATVSTGVSIVKGQEAASQQRKAADLQRRQADLQAARQRRDTIRQTRASYAQAAQAAANQGASLTSASEGGLGSIASQGNENLSFLDQYKGISNNINARLGKATKLNGQAEMFGQIAALAGKGANFAASTQAPTATLNKIPTFSPTIKPFNPVLFAPAKVG